MDVKIARNPGGLLKSEPVQSRIELSPGNIPLYIQ